MKVSVQSVIDRAALETPFSQLIKIWVGRYFDEAGYASFDSSFMAKINT
jgi:hypothetical protein